MRNCTRDEGGPFEAGSQVQGIVRVAFERNWANQARVPNNRPPYGDMRDRPINRLRVGDLCASRCSPTNPPSCIKAMDWNASVRRFCDGQAIL